MINPTEEDIGRGVVYDEWHGDKLYKSEFGVITSFRDSCVFVRFGRARQSEMCGAESLRWEFP